jgi:hypothetical protein
MVPALQSAAAEKSPKNASGLNSAPGTVKPPRRVIGVVAHAMRTRRMLVTT